MKSIQNSLIRNGVYAVLKAKEPAADIQRGVSSIRYEIIKSSKPPYIAKPEADILHLISERH